MHKMIDNDEGGMNSRCLVLTFSMCWGNSNAWNPRTQGQALSDIPAAAPLTRLTTHCLQEGIDTALRRLPGYRRLCPPLQRLPNTRVSHVWICNEFSVRLILTNSVWHHTRHSPRCLLVSRLSNFVNWTTSGTRYLQMKPFFYFSVNSSAFFTCTVSA